MITKQLLFTLIYLLIFYFLMLLWWCMFTSVTSLVYFPSHAYYSFPHFISDVQKDCESKKSENGSKWLLSEGGEEKQLTCCANCITQFEIEARNSRNTCHGESTSSSLPSWLRDESKRLNSHDQVIISISAFIYT